MEPEKKSRNKTLTLSQQDILNLTPQLKKLKNAPMLSDVCNRIFQGNSFHLMEKFPSQSVNLLFADPPYNLTKKFDDMIFQARNMENYIEWADSWIKLLPRLMKPNGSIYICGDWRSSPALYSVLSKYFVIRNRITWEREKGRGAKSNWKNSHEDIWFCTLSTEYTFNLEAVKVKRKVIAPYRQDGNPKDWTTEGENKFRLTAPSNLWTDLTVPFWSMSENTDHPTQKPEKLLAKIILASSNPGDLVLDPFCGSGTTCVTANKLGRNFTGMELNEKYCLTTLKRLEIAKNKKEIQGFQNGVFWDRNYNPKSKNTGEKS